MNSVWVGRKYMPDQKVPEHVQKYFGATHINTPNIHPVPGRDSSPCVVTGPGVWKEKIYHFLPDKPPSSAGEELQSEYFVKYSDFIQVVKEIYAIRDKFRHLVQITEMRMCAGDDIPMSPARGNQAFIGIHFTWYRKYEEVLKVIPEIEGVLDKYKIKPHVGKIFVLSGPKFEELFGNELLSIRSLIQQHDPKRKFANDWTDKYIFNQNTQLAKM